MRLFKEGELRLLWPFYLDAIISPMLFFMPAFLVVYFRDLGLSIFQISIIIMMMPLSMLLFEVPTGAVADIYGRKFSVLLGTVIQGIAVISIFFLNSYYAFLIAFATIGIGATFNSGAREAWIADLIKKERKDFLHRYFAKSGSLDSFGLVVSGVLGAFLVKHYGISVIWIAAGVSFFVSFFLLGLAKEHFVKREVKIGSSFKEIKKQSLISIRYAKDHPVISLFLIASSIIAFAGVVNGDLAWITFLQGLNFPDYAFGYMLSAIGFVGIFAPLISLKFMKKGKERRFILGVLMLTVLSLVLVLFVQSIAFALSILLAELFFFKMRSPVERVYFHRFIKSKLRATVGSVESMLTSIVGIVAMPLAGLSVDYLGARYTILLSALLMIPAFLIFLRIKEK